METEIVSELYKNYYMADVTPSSLVSSHWRDYSEKFNVKMDNKGNLIQLGGYGFGHQENRGIVNILSDYICHLSYFSRLPYKRGILEIAKLAIPIWRDTNTRFDFNCFKQVCALNLIKQHMTEEMMKTLTFLVIGDGYGFMACLIKTVFPKSTIVLVDLGKVLLFQAYYCQKVFPQLSHLCINKDMYLQNVSYYNFIYCPAEFLHRIDWLKYDIIINIASMQEMNEQTIETYFKYIRKYSNEDNLFYCCNRERKVLVGGEVIEFSKYPWKPQDRHWVDEICPWYKYYISNFKVKHFDGSIRHRLTKLYTCVQKGRSVKMITGKTRHLYLRPLCPEDITQFYIDALNDVEVVKYTEVCKTKWCWSNTRDYIARTQGLIGIFLDGKHIGNTHVYETTEGNIEIGIMIFDKTKWGHGYATEAINFIVEYISNNTSFGYITAGYYKENKGSEKIFKKNGFIVFFDNGVKVRVMKSRK